MSISHKQWLDTFYINCSNYVPDFQFEDSYWGNYPQLRDLMNEMRKPDTHYGSKKKMKKLTERFSSGKATPVEHRALLTTFSTILEGGQMVRWRFPAKPNDIFQVMLDRLAQKPEQKKRKSAHSPLMKKVVAYDAFLANQHVKNKTKHPHLNIDQKAMEQGHYIMNTVVGFMNQECPPRGSKEGIHNTLGVFNTIIADATEASWRRGKAADSMMRMLYNSGTSWENYTLADWLNGASTKSPVDLYLEEEREKNHIAHLKKWELSYEERLKVHAKHGYWPPSGLEDYMNAKEREYQSEKKEKERNREFLQNEQNLCNAAILQFGNDMINNITSRLIGEKPYDEKADAEEITVLHWLTRLRDEKRQPYAFAFNSHVKAALNVDLECDDKKKKINVLWMKNAEDKLQYVVVPQEIWRNDELQELVAQSPTLQKLVA